MISMPSDIYCVLGIGVLDAQHIVCARVFSNFKRSLSIFMAAPGNGTKLNSAGRSDSDVNNRAQIETYFVTIWFPLCCKTCAHLYVYPAAGNPRQSSHRRFWTQNYWRTKSLTTRNSLRSPFSK